MRRLTRLGQWGLFALFCTGCGSDSKNSDANSNIGGSAQAGATQTSLSTFGGSGGTNTAGTTLASSGGNAAQTGGTLAVTGGSAALSGGSAALTGGNPAVTGGNAAATGGMSNALGGNANATGGMLGTGGAIIASGGSLQSGGTAAGVTGGAQAFGGSNNTGGAPLLTGGSVATGGSSDLQSGGALNMGGTATTGGSSAEATGGTTSVDPSTSTGGTTAPGTTGPVPIVLTVDMTASTHEISPLIYGVNPGKVACSDARARFTMCRLGGNPWSTYNWENNASNAGSQKCFENNADLGASDVPAQTVTSLIAEANAQDATTTFTIPIIDYVAADKLGGSLTTCSGDVNQSGDNYLETRFKHNQARKGSAFSDPPDVTDAYVYQDESLQYTKTRAGDAKVIVTLDNQPELWSYTHQRVHPDHTTYAEVVNRNVEYASMVRDNWPNAEITGYGGYGYYAFLNLQDAPNPPGNMQFLDYYLESMHEAENTAGRRLIDYLDIHWYSNVNVDGIDVLSTDASSGIAAARMQAPRSLWDTTYIEPSWIGGLGAPIELIPWVMSKITAHYPNTKLAISEWAYGGESSISGAIAVADALGIFGREGVGLASVVPIADDESFLVGAFSMFRNYDGAGASFGDLSVSATSNDVSKVSVYASKDSTSPEHVVVVVINRSDVEQAVTLNIGGAGDFVAADVFQLTSASAIPTAAAPLATSTANAFTPTLPPYSVSVIVPKTQH